ncbi:TRAP transporter substrate-binding protein [Curvibacter sp. HBC61]|uniref:TRAP transporter substrate-binding protein n=1 Tax=Curvibacter cyanobacteriorum TaxID=3026422 RepID=A0ABT5MY25_9BURK|nr:TRAP transporter substrate-binding protein [Curvibacter sp. HBC61]MDD0837697.1 TRAP transporter substrate-binding protein [Curvibacter sp. HBC61]
MIAFRRTLLAASVAAASLLSLGVSAQDIQARTIKFPSASQKGHPQVMGVEHFAELVAKKSGGKMVVKPFPGGALGPDAQVVSAMQGGTVEMNVMNASLLAGNVKEMAVFDYPFLFANAQEADAVADGAVGRKLLDKLQERGLVGLAYWDLGFRQMHTAKKPIRNADEVKGMKMRVIPTSQYVDFMNAIGANATPMPYTETYSALEQGAIDGMTNPLLNIVSEKFYEVSKHLTLSNHMYTPQAVIVSKKFWDKLSATEQKILQDAASETALYQRKVAREEATKALAELKKQGMQVHELTAQDIAKLRERAKPATDKLTQQVGEPLVKEVFAAVEKVRSGK